MKRPLIIFSALIAGTLLFSSCNKNLKDDIKDLKKQNSELQEKLNGIANAIGSDEPITSTTTFKDRDNVARTITGTFNFKSSGRSTQSLVKYPDGTYEVYIERYGSLDWEEGAWVAFRYNPTTKAITEKRGGQYWNDYGNYNNKARFDEAEFSTGLTFTINIKKLDLTTGVISLDVNIAGTDEYANGANEWNLPSKGKAVTTSFSFDGKLRVFEMNQPPA